MLKQIAAISPELTQFIEELNLSLSKPQQRHVRQIADGLITIEGDKNLRYFGSTNTTLSPQDALTFFGNRWSCEVANWYVAEKLGTPFYQGK